jgi:hypothetical protein
LHVGGAQVFQLREQNFFCHAMDWGLPVAGSEQRRER